ncbi:DUF4426 domain-containing protein [Paraferrimonas sp. SM1919]|uniref:DUF4426 domain-containing protein n=1 Tax=Paraferrimonas sp. SM1919 TaxID=2662263 RepID=UPI0013CFDEB7|nr:DUF4426 domain-containing protein [Paraferrimonas sp. SM1919]
MKQLFIGFALTLLTLVSHQAHAEQKTIVGNYEIHYVAFPSTFITPEVAKQYGVERSRYNALVNISVLNRVMANNPAVEANVSGHARNLISTMKTLNFKEIKEGDAIYYIAEVGHRNEEVLNFEVQVSVGRSLNTKIKFNQKFYVD